MPTIGTEFDGTTLPTGWTSTPWTGGTSTVSGGQVTVDGAWAAPDTYYAPGRSLEFVATLARLRTFRMLALGVDYDTSRVLGDVRHGRYVGHAVCAYE